MKLELDAAQDRGPVLDLEPEIVERERWLRTVFAVKEAVAPLPRSSTRSTFCIHVMHNVDGVGRQGGFGRAQPGMRLLHRCRQRP
jgi:hypothetical protein